MHSKALTPSGGLRKRQPDQRTHTLAYLGAGPAPSEYPRIVASGLFNGMGVEHETRIPAPIPQFRLNGHPEKPPKAIDSLDLPTWGGFGAADTVLHIL